MLGTEESLRRKEAPAPPHSVPSPLSIPQARSPEGPPGLRARGSARHGRRRRPGADGRGGSERRLFINPRRSSRCQPAKSTVEASALSFEQVSKRPPRRVAPAIAPQRAQLPASSRLSGRREAGRQRGRAAATRKARAGGRRVPRVRGAFAAPSGGRASGPPAAALSLALWRPNTPGSWSDYPSPLSSPQWCAVNRLGVSNPADVSSQVRMCDPHGIRGNRPNPLESSSFSEILSGLPCL